MICLDSNQSIALQNKLIIFHYIITVSKMVQFNLLFAYVRLFFQFICVCFFHSILTVTEN